MREILFRGKCKTDNKWLYGFPYVTRKNAVKINWYCSEFGSMRTDEVIPETVGQFTGVPDMNKRPIFEGDIVVDRTMVFRVIGQIVYNTDKAAFVVKNSVTEESLDKHRWLEIIGNIYDNSELLKGEDTSW